MMTMNRPFEVQQMFASLFRVGTEMQVTVIPSGNEETIRVRSTGGCFGILSPDYEFPVGTLITAQVANIQNGVPVFEPTKEWLLARTPQKGRVVFFTPRGVVVELKENTYAVYQPAQGLSEDLQAALREDREVEVCSLTKTSDGTYTAQKLQMIPEAEKPQPTDPLVSWNDAKISEVLALGSRKMLGQAKLGKILLVEVTGSKVAQMSKGGTVTLREGFFPRDVKRALVRVVFIPQDGQPQVEFVKADNPKPENQASKAFAAKAEDTTAVGYRNDEVVQKAREMGSLWFAGPYKLGFNYRVTIEDGVPVFAPDKSNPKYPVGIVNIDIEDKCQERFSEEDEVICRINDIRHAGGDIYTFKVSILKVL